MRLSSGNQRFFASTRGRLVQLLRRAGATVEELAGALGLTDNAVRAHLTTLERDGLVRQAGVRRGVSKPASAYALTPQAEQLFPKAYGAILRQFLDVLGERLAPAEVDCLAREVGRRMAAGHGATGDLRQRAQRATALLNDLGGLAELEEDDGGYTICGYSCPLAEAVPGHPEVCHLAETLLTEVVGTAVGECCERGETARCRFTIPGSVS